MVEHLLIALVVLLAGAKLGGALAERFGQPAVLGELIAGVAIGALPLVGIGQLAFLGTNDVVDALADLGVILLLFEVGLSTRLADLMKVGVSAFLVAPTSTSSWARRSRRPASASPPACSRTWAR
jgi:Kef-type K+ transport system membrane component KefB